MADEGTEQLGGQRWPGKTAPGLEGLYGRLRISVAGRPVGTLVVEGIYVALIPDIRGPADATVMCADQETMGKLLRGELNPFISSMQRLARLTGNRGFGTRRRFCVVRAASSRSCSCFHLDDEARAYIDAVLAETVRDPVGPEFMAPPARPLETAAEAVPAV